MSGGGNYYQNSCQFCFQACISFLRCFRALALTPIRKSWCVMEWTPSWPSKASKHANLYLVPISFRSRSDLVLDATVPWVFREPTSFYRRASRFVASVSRKAGAFLFSHCSRHFPGPSNVWKVWKVTFSGQQKNNWFFGEFCLSWMSPSLVLFLIIICHCFFLASDSYSSLFFIAFCFCHLPFFPPSAFKSSVVQICWGDVSASWLHTPRPSPPAPQQKHRKKANCTCERPAPKGKGWPGLACFHLFESSTTQSHHQPVNS